MFGDDPDRVATAIAYTFGDDTPPNIGAELQARGATVSQGSCSICNGTLYDYNHEVICGNCSTVIGAETHTYRSTDRWESFATNRSQYYSSNNYRCVGGFPHVYEWVRREEIDDTVGTVDPVTFYK